MKLYFDDEAFDGQLQRSVAKADSGMANVGECLAVAEQVGGGDRDAWFRAWASIASRLVEQGDAALASGHRVSARGAYLRATEYFRQAFFFHRDDLDGVELRRAYPASVAAFRNALALTDLPWRVLSKGLSGYLLMPPGPGGPYPTIMHVGGYDGTAEELYASAAAALDRGYAFVAIDGPGQGAVLYDRRIPMRPDWENVVPDMVDALTTAPEIDPERVVLVGRSFGGFLAPRGAAGESRLAAMIVDPGQFDIGATLRARLGDLMQRVDDPSADEEFDSLLTIPAIRQLFAPRMVTHGVTSARAYCAEIVKYTNAQTVERVACPTFVTDNETDLVSTGQGKMLFDALVCPKAFRLFTKEEGAEGHCEGMAPAIFWTAAFDWLDATLAT